MKNYHGSDCIRVNEYSNLTSKVAAAQRDGAGGGGGGDGGAAAASLRATC